MATQTHARPKRRRSSCHLFLWILIFAWVVMLVGRNVARVLLLPDFSVRAPVKGPNYYEILGVTPMVNDTTLRRLRKQYNAKNHPDKTGDDDPATINKFLRVQEAFDTLSDGRRRCEYDKDHAIRGKWFVQSCRDAFREEYKQIAREEWTRYWEIKDAQDKKTTDRFKKSKPESSDPENEPERKVTPTMPKTEKPASRKSESESSRVKSEEERPPSPEPEARPAVPAATVEHETQDAVEVLTSGVARLMEFVVKFWAEAMANIGAKWAQLPSSIVSTIAWIRGIRLARDDEHHEGALETQI